MQQGCAGVEGLIEPALLAAHSNAGRNAAVTEPGDTQVAGALGVHDPVVMYGEDDVVAGAAAPETGDMGNHAVNHSGCRRDRGNRARRGRGARAGFVQGVLMPVMSKVFGRSCTSPGTSTGCDGHPGASKSTSPRFNSTASPHQRW